MPRYDGILSSTRVVNNGLFLACSGSTSGRTCIRSLGKGELRRVGLPSLNSVDFDNAGSSGRYFFNFASFAAPKTACGCSVSAGACRLCHTPGMGFGPSRFVARRVFFPDGSNIVVPVFLACGGSLGESKRGPMFLCKCKKFNVDLGPKFDVGHVPFLRGKNVCTRMGLQNNGRCNRR